MNPDRLSKLCMGNEALIQQLAQRAADAGRSRATVALLTTSHLYGILHKAVDASSPSHQLLWTTSAQVASVLQAMAEAKHAEAVRIGQLIANLRERQGWSQQDLAHEIDVSISSVSRWETGKHKGYSKNVRKLAAALGVEPGVLLPADDLMIGSQLDRIEHKLDAIHGLLIADDGDPAAVVAEVADRLQAAAGSPPPKAPARAATPRAARRRKSA